MFQTYDPPEVRQSGAERVDKLRRLMAKARLDAVLVPRADEHQGEYVPPSAERLKWLTGFSGSAGLAVVGARGRAVRRWALRGAGAEPSRHAHLRGAADPQAKLAEWLGKH
jgi:Xaa-Pro aminopeptidase